MGRSPDEISRYQGTIPMIAGIIGSFLGGFLSDRVAQKGKINVPSVDIVTKRNKVNEQIYINF